MAAHAQLQALEHLDEAGRRQACLAEVQQARAEVAQAFQQQAPASQLVRQLSDRFDALIAALYRAAGLPGTPLISLVALGGYGRGELFPFSDLDLLILYEQGEDELSRRLLEQVIYPLWDAKVSVGYAVRGLEDTLKLAASDLTVCTSLLDARMLAGDEGPYHALYAAALREFFGPEVKRFIDGLRAERAARHQRFGETIYLLEPNIKLGKGGLRDLNTGLWAAKARFGVNELRNLAATGGATARQLKLLDEAQGFFRQLRMAMHLQAGRAQDHLLFELQEALAQRFFPALEMFGVKRHSAAVEPAVERLMHAFYRHARNVVLETEGLLDRCGQVDWSTQPEGEPASADPGEHLLVGEHVRSSEPGRFWEQPPEILRAFRVSCDTGRPLHWQTRDAISEAIADEPGLQLPADGRASQLWLDLVCDPEPRLQGTILFDAHDAGLIAAMIPEFEPCTGRIQHDLYHVYTVDLHSLYVVALLKAWRRGDQAGEHAGAVELMSKIEDPRGLMLAALLHDVGKPLGHGHAEKGGRLAVGVAARLGLNPTEQAAVRFLVEQHLTMAHLSQRRDLSDPAVIRTLADQVGSVELLRMLYLLTLADAAMTAPGNLTAWKASLLEELYVRTYVHLSHGEAVAEEARQRMVVERRAALELELRRQGDGAGAMLGRLPEPMLLAFEPEDLAHHLREARAFEEAHPEAVVRVDARPRPHGVFEVTVCCWDSPGRLACITGVMLAHRIEVLAAQVHTLDASPAGAEARPGIVVDIFSVRAPLVDEEGGEEVWAPFAADLERAVRGELRVPELVARHTRRSGLPRRVVPRVERLVRIDNQISERLTVIDVQAPDRTGVLYAITQSLSELGLSIHLSKVATEAGRVVDIFYVSDGRGGGKVTDQERLSEVRRCILEALASLDGGPSTAERT